MNGEIYFANDREKLNEGLRERGYMPNVRYPADCYIAESAGLELENIPADNALGWDGYFTWVWRTDSTESGERIRYKVLDPRELVPIRVWREYNTDQRKVIHQYWELLSEESRYYAN